MPLPSPLGLEIEEALDRCGYTVDRAGHTQYLLRYRTNTGVPFAVGRTAKTGVLFWLSADERFRTSIEARGWQVEKSEPIPKKNGKRATGRNSNLDQIPEFKGRPLWKTKVATADD